MAFSAFTQEAEATGERSPDSDVQTDTMDESGQTKQGLWPEKNIRESAENTPFVFL